MSNIFSINTSIANSKGKEKLWISIYKLVSL